MLLAAAVLLPALDQTRDTSSHEGLYGCIARDVLAGRPFAPRIGGRAYAEKPPAFFWAVALAGEVRGRVDLLAGRSVSALATAATALSVLVLGRKLHGPRAGLLGAAAFLACPLAIHAGRTLRLDATFTAFMLLACVALLDARGIARGLAGGIFLGLAVLVKGPLAILVVVLFLRVHGSPRAPAIVATVLAFLATTGAWATGVVLEAGEEPLRATVFGRDLVTGVEQHARSPFFYVPLVPLGLGGVAPFVLAAAIEKRRALVTAAVVLVALSLIPGKRAPYLVPIYPFAALAAGSAADSKLLRHWPVVLAALLGLAALAYPIAVALRASLVAADLVLSIAFAGCAAVLAKRRGPAAALVVTVLATSLGIAAYHTRGVELLEEENGAVALGAALDALPRGTPVALAADPEAVFFSSAPFVDLRGESADALGRWLSANPSGVVVVDEMNVRLAGREVTRARVRGRPVVLEAR